MTIAHSIARQLAEAHTVVTHLLSKTTVDARHALLKQA